MQEAFRTIRQLGRRIANIRFGMGVATHPPISFASVKLDPTPPPPTAPFLSRLFPPPFPFYPIDPPSTPLSLAWDDPHSVIGLLGCGSLGRRFLRALMEYGFIGTVYLTGSTPERGKEIAAEINAEQEMFFPNSPLKIRYVASNADLPKLCKTIFLGVKPKLVKSVLIEMRPNLIRHADVLLVSFAAAGTTTFMYELLERKVPSIARVITTTAVQYRKGTSLLYASPTTNPHHFESLKAFFAPLGTVDVVENEAQLDIGVAVACSTGFLLELIRVWKAVLVKTGTDPRRAQRIIAGMMQGAGETGENEEDLEKALDDVGKEGNSLTRAQIHVLKEAYAAFGKSYETVGNACAALNDTLHETYSSSALYTPSKNGPPKEEKPNGVFRKRIDVLVPIPYPDKKIARHTFLSTATPTETPAPLPKEEAVNTACRR